MHVTSAITKSKACLVEMLVGRFSHLKLHANRDFSFVPWTGQHTKTRFVFHALIDSAI
jgi:hypothetical protein